VIDLLSCKSNCGWNRANACVFEFHITQRYAGDNYRVYFWVPNTNWTIGSAAITAWKRVFIEQDKMCRRGGMLLENPFEEPDAKKGSMAVLIAKMWDGNQWIEVDNLNPGDIIDFFDSEKPFNEKVPNEIGDNNQPVRVLDRNSNPGEPYVTIALGIKEGQNCVGNYALKNNYDGSVPHNYDSGDKDWDFEVGKSAGICVKGSGYYEANTSQLNRRNNITGPFDDAFVSFNIPKGNGTGVIPYLPKQWFDTALTFDKARFSQIWFENFINAGGGPPPLDKKLNYSAFPILYSGKLRFLVEAISQTALLGRPMCLPFVLARCIVPLQ